MKPVDASKPPSMIPTWQDKWLLTTLPSGASKTTNRSVETLWGYLENIVGFGALETDTHGEAAHWRLHNQEQGKDRDEMP